MSSPRASAWMVLFVGLFAVGLLLYGPMLADYFIADDFINFGFVRQMRGSWWSFFDPTRTFSDPVTQSRYKPLYTWYTAAIDGVFGDHVLAHHVWSLALHALVGVGVGALAWSLYASRSVALVSALLFVSSRLHSQTVMWISASYRLFSTFLALLCLVSAFGRSAPLRLFAQGALFSAALLMNPDLIATLPVLAFLAVYYRSDRPLRFLQPLALCTLIGLAFTYANWLSTRAFPDSMESQGPDATRALQLLLALFVPFELPMTIKLALTAVVLIWTLVALGSDDRRVLLLACTLPSVALWSVLTEYVLAPRYLYFSGAFSAILVARMLLDGCRHLTSLVHGEAVRTRARPALAAVLLLGWLLVNAYALRRHDLVLYEYRARLGERLAALRAQVLRQGSAPRLAVFVRPRNNLPPRDRAFFEDALTFVADPRQATRIVDTDVEQYLAKLGPELESAYWYLPWFP